MIEIWKDIEGYEGIYQVSNMGRVKSLKNNLVLKPILDKKGYHSVHLYKDKKQYSFRINRLVYETFVGKIPDKMQVNHIDENKTNDSISNLNLMTNRENSNWGTRNKRISEAETNHPKKSKQIVALKNGKLELYFPSTQEAKRNGFIQQNICKCCKGLYHTVSGYKWRYLDDYLADWWEEEMEKGA